MSNLSKSRGGFPCSHVGFSDTRGEESNIAEQRSSISAVLIESKIFHDFRRIAAASCSALVSLFRSQ